MQIKNRKRAALLLLIMMSSGVGCSGKQQQNHMHAAAELSMEPIKVELSWNPEAVSVNRKVTFQAVVTQANEPVNDAKEVLFEIVDQQDEANTLELQGESSGEGSYTAVGMLEKEGTYLVTSHITARTQHSMPSKTLVVTP